MHIYECQNYPKARRSTAIINWILQPSKIIKKLCCTTIQCSYAHVLCNAAPIGKLVSVGVPCIVTDVGM